MIGTTFDSLTTSLANKLITHSENEITKYLSKRYDVSLWSSVTSTPPMVISLCETLTEGYMYQRMSRGGKEAMARGQELIKQAISNLDKIAKYESDLIDSSGSVVSDFSNTSYRVLANTDGYTPTFGEDNELEWRVDPDKINDIKSSRD